jgi:hypothetical protein
VQRQWLPHAQGDFRSLVGSVSGEAVHAREVSLEGLFSLMSVQHHGLTREDLNPNARSTEEVF